jgi:hypothetical protein
MNTPQRGNMQVLQSLCRHKEHVRADGRLKRLRPLLTELAGYVDEYKHERKQAQEQIK